MVVKPSRQDSFFHEFKQMVEEIRQQLFAPREPPRALGKDTLLDKIKRQEQDIVQLTLAANRKQHTVEAQLREIAALQDELRAQRAQRLAAERELLHVKNDHESLRREQNESLAQYNDLARAHSATEGHLNQARAEIYALKGEKTALEGNVSALKLDNEALRREIDALRRESSLVARENESLRRLNRSLEQLTQLEAPQAKPQMQFQPCDALDDPAQAIVEPAWTPKPVPLRLASPFSQELVSEVSLDNLTELVQRYLRPDAPGSPDTRALFDDGETFALLALPKRKLRSCIMAVLFLVRLGFRAPDKSSISQFGCMT